VSLGVPNGTLLEGRTAVVVGGAGGIGFGTVVALADAGARVVVVDLPETTQRGLNFSPATFVGADVTDEDVVSTLADDVRENFGTVDLLVNAQGVISVAPVRELSTAAWDAVMAVNIRSVFLTCRAFVPDMLDRGDGCIVNIASISGKRGDPGFSHYCASKFAVVGFTQSLAMEVAGNGVRVNAVCPGNVDTPLHQKMLHQMNGTLEEEVDRQLIKRPQTPREVGDAVVFLATNTGITGQSINVDGGVVFY
jgi:meso-butanediol dehydrogenase/(S,S)-butanediol dehydrogenase/diacetyl reductase